MAKAKETVETGFGFAAGAIGILSWLNITPEQVGETLFVNCRLILPFAVFSAGVLAGWGLSKLLNKGKTIVPSGSIASPITPSMAPSMSELGDPLELLTPSEIEFLFRIYHKSSVYVGVENIAIAKKLNNRGLIYRLGFEGDRNAVIQQCDVVLADELVPILNAKADELKEEEN